MTGHDDGQDGGCGRFYPSTTLYKFKKNSSLKNIHHYFLISGNLILIPHISMQAIAKPACAGKSDYAECFGSASGTEHGIFP
ncbi:hypothetical protein [Aquitalea magnusonii]|uniref:hypothetical protein n=1 Tax=Aquitalea magnusonii TaxID=332411 RepID=UPI0011AE622C|nr:hypothetical protein [Aquitalea magnusonii]